MHNFWPTCLSRFEQELSTQQFNTWIKPLQTELIETASGSNAIRVLAPNKFVQQWVKDRFLNKIESIAAELLPNNFTVELCISQAKPEAVEKNNPSKSPAVHLSDVIRSAPV